MTMHSRRLADSMPAAPTEPIKPLEKQIEQRAENKIEKQLEKQPRAFFIVQAGMLLAIIAPLVLTFYAASALTRGAVSWHYPAAAFAFASLTNLGTTAGYHRMLTHQAFRAHPVVQYTLLILGAIAGMSSPVQWARDHIYHHSHSDTPEDIHSPHTPRYEGRRFPKLWQWADAHMGWTMRWHPVPVSQKSGSDRGYARRALCG